MPLEDAAPAKDVIIAPDASNDIMPINLSGLFPESASNTDVVPIGSYDPVAFDVITGVVQLLYLTSNEVPSMQEILDRCGYSYHTVKTILSSKVFGERLWARGIRWPANWTPESQDATAARSHISPQQVFALQIVTDPTRSGTFKKKLQDANISYATWQNWLREPEFAAAVSKTAEQMLQDNIAGVHGAMTNGALSGNPALVKLFYEVSGRHDPTRQQTQDIGRMIMLLIEVISRRVTDTTLLGEIVNDFETILKGGNIKPLDSIPANYQPGEQFTSQTVRDGVEAGFFEMNPDKD